MWTEHSFMITGNRIRSFPEQRIWNVAEIWNTHIKCECLRNNMQLWHSFQHANFTVKGGQHFHSTPADQFQFVNHIFLFAHCSLRSTYRPWCVLARPFVIADMIVNILKTTGDQIGCCSHSNRSADVKTPLIPEQNSIYFHAHMNGASQTTVYMEGNRQMSFPEAAVCIRRRGRDVGVRATFPWQTSIARVNLQ